MGRGTGTTTYSASKLDMCYLLAYPRQWGELRERGELRRLCMAPGTHAERYLTACTQSVYAMPGGRPLANQNPLKKEGLLCKSVYRGHYNSQPTDD